MRSMEFLLSLDVETLGALLDMPAVEPPDEWSATTCRSVLREILTVFEEHGVRYEGEIAIPPPVEAEATAAGSVEELTEIGTPPGGAGSRAWLGY